MTQDTFKKNDDHKLKHHLLPIEPIEEVTQVFMNGATKYGENNWMLANGDVDKKRYYSAIIRHLFAWMKGETHDKDSKLSHLAHAACGVLILMSIEKKTNND